MKCSRCRKPYREEQSRCPFCGEPNPALSGVFQTSTVLISVGGSDLVYRSVDDVPARLRTRLLKSTNGSNSATILIADQKGRKEIARAMRNLPGGAPHHRLRGAILGVTGEGGWVRTMRRRLIAAILLLIALIAIGAVFSHRLDSLVR